MRWNRRDDQAHTLGGHTSLLFQQQTLSTCELATRIVVHDKRKKIWHKYSLSMAKKGAFRSKRALAFSNDIILSRFQS